MFVSVQHLASFLLLRGPFAWLGWAWVGCDGSRSTAPGHGNDGPDFRGVVAPGSKWDKKVLNTE